LTVQRKENRQFNKPAVYNCFLHVLLGLAYLSRFSDDEVINGLAKRFLFLYSKSIYTGHTPNTAESMLVTKSGLISLKGSPVKLSNETKSKDKKFIIAHVNVGGGMLWYYPKDVDPSSVCHRFILILLVGIRFARVIEN